MEEKDEIVKEQDKEKITIAQYQEFCGKEVKKGYTDVVFALGLGGESGEVLDIIKKSYRDQKPFDREHLKEELGDVMWYIANLCNVYGYTMDEIIAYNVAKLSKRYDIKK